ncbi:Bre2p NDAI_0I02340 [Naumovozyma dairenensis CBS 421]|uniref:SPRY domain-containing protein n=1 Tax=Naumovozyma dairenensis (strain ATCC 10597 / BCRC 20456 / CBS 421 / NBRC 0211 / NRRL Y-12639) TaxID=1071378 RepID=G0WG92_NAUDC|nr:hypothetical protein NDAI_0I02340 [Naumovozyma dairenensis CBS 421]CCD26803.1 hypothetical protein NDAI_0I02340 [Naumovozyma dairenensis CBS 421]
MKLGIIPYQENTDFVSGKDTIDNRPFLPNFQTTHNYKDLEFVKPEDIPLNKRNFIYRVCSPNPLFKELGYCVSEYPFDEPGFNLMDRSNRISLLQGTNDTISVKEYLGWRTSRADVCIKEGTAYWEVEILNGGTPIDKSAIKTANGNDASNDNYNHRIPLQVKKDLLNTTPHVRMGISRREASLEGPVGFDSYGYGLRDNALESVHKGKIQQVLKTMDAVRSGDILSFVLELPSIDVQKEQAAEYTRRRIEALIQHSTKINNVSNNMDYAEENGPLRKKIKIQESRRAFQKALLDDIDYDNVIRDHIAIRYKNQLFFEATDYVKTTKPDYYSSDKREREDYYQLTGSSLRVYLNGEYLGNAFEDLKPVLPPFSELQYNEKFYQNYWRHGRPLEENSSDIRNSTYNLELKTERGSLLRNKYVNNNKLGYYPTVSCFNGGTARIITQPRKMKYLNDVKEHVRDIESLKTLDIIFEEQIAEDIVWDIIDEVEECVTTSKEGVPMNARWEQKILTLI